MYAAFAASLTLVMATPVAADQGWTQPVNAQNWRLYGLPAPTLGTSPLRLQDLTLCTSGMLAVNSTGLPFHCATLSDLPAIPAGTLLGNPSATSAAPIGITVGAGLNLSLAGVLTATGGADALGFYLVTQSANAPPNAFDLGSLSSGALYSTVSSGHSTLSVVDPYQVAVDGTDVAPARLASKVVGSYPISFSSPPAAPPIPGLAVWLKADAGVTSSGGNVSTWVDQVNGYSFAVVGTAPTLVTGSMGGLPVVRFNDTGGTSNSCYLSSTISTSGWSGATVLYVVRTAPDATLSSLYQGIVNIRDGANARWSFNVSDKTDGFGVGGVGPNGIPGLGTYSPALTNSQIVVEAYRYDKTTWRLSGTYATTVADTSFPGATATMHVGSVDYGGGQSTADVEEVLVYDHSLSDDDLKIAAAYAQGRAGSNVGINEIVEASHATSGVTAGTYTAPTVTFDRWGHATSASSVAYQSTQLAGLSVLGRGANSTGTMAAITATSGSNGALRESGGTVGFGNISEAIVQNLTADLASKVPTTRNVNTALPLTGGGALSGDLNLGINVFGASGASHSTGIVPDPGATAGTTRYLREDGTWVVVSTADKLVAVNASDTAADYLANKLVGLAPVSITTVSPSGGPPTTGLKLWLKADVGVTLSGSNVTGWADQSGNGNNVVTATTSPTFVASSINGIPGISFGTGSTSTEGLVNTSTNLLTAGSARSVIAVVAPTNVVANAVLTFRLNGTQWASCLGVNSHPNIVWSDTAVVDISTTTAALSSTSPLLAEWYGTSNPSGTLTHDQNGTARSVVSSTMGNAESGTTGFAIGYQPGVTGRSFVGAISEIFVYDHILSAGDIATLRGYVNTRYAMSVAGASGGGATSYQLQASVGYDNSTITLNGTSQLQVGGFTGGDVTSSAGSRVLTLGNIPTGTTQAGAINATSVSTPATPAAGHGNVFYDVSDQNYAVVTEAGTYKHMVQSQTCTGQFISAISDAGFPICATVSYAAISGKPVACTDYVSLTCVTGTTDLGGTNATPTVTGVEDGAAQRGSLLATEIATPSVPAAGKLKAYASATGVLAAETPSGTVSNTYFPSTCGSNTWASALTSSGAMTCTQPAFSSLSGSATCSQVGTAGAYRLIDGGSCSGSVWPTSGTWANGQALITTAGTVTTVNQCSVNASCSASSDLAGTYPGPSVVAIHDGAGVSHATNTSTWTTGSLLETDGVGHVITNPTLACTQDPGFTGDVIKSAGSCATQVASVTDLASVRWAVGTWTNDQILATSSVGSSIKTLAKSSIFSVPLYYSTQMFAMLNVGELVEGGQASAATGSIGTVRTEYPVGVAAGTVTLSCRLSANHITGGTFTFKAARNGADTSAALSFTSGTATGVFTATATVSSPATSDAWGLDVSAVGTANSCGSGTCPVDIACTELLQP